MKKNGVMVGVVFVLITLISALGIYFYEKSRQSSTEKIDNDTSQVTPTKVETGDETLRSITLAELESANGEDGNKCFIAIRDTVYEITDSSLWVEGEHTTSSGRAECGKDLTNVIGQSPHGTSKLSSSKVNKIGTLEK